MICNDGTHKNWSVIMGHIKNWSVMMGHIKNWSVMMGHIKNWSVMMGHTKIDLIDTNTVASVSCSMSFPVVQNASSFVFNVTVPLIRSPRKCKCMKKTIVLFAMWCSSLTGFTVNLF